FWIGLYVYRRKPTAPLHRSFAVMAVTISLWTTGLALAHYVPIGNTWTLRLAFAASSMIPLAVLAFVQSSPPRLPGRHSLVSRLFFCVASFFSAASLTPFVVVSVLHDGRNALATYGLLHQPFAIFVIGCFAYSLFLLTKKYRLST